MSNVTKHMKLMQEIQSQVAKRHLLEISEFEQFVACHEDLAQAQKQLEELLVNPEIDPGDLLRLVMLYMLRYETNPQINLARYNAMLKSRGVTDNDIKLINILKVYAGIEKRTTAVDLFENKDLFQIARGQIKRGLMGVTNIFSQHKPLLYRTLIDLIQNRLPESVYPILDGTPSKANPTQIVVFIIGGITYEEATVINELSTQNRVSIVLGGTTIHNSSSFLEGLRDFLDIKKPPKA